MSRLPCLVLSLTLAAAGVGAETFTVNRTTDAVDSNPGDGVCGTGLLCSLRQAVQEANALPGRDTITLRAGAYVLTLAGQDEDAAATGDLDVVDDLEIVGAGAGTTVIDGGGLDRVLHVLGDEHPELLLHGVTVTGGQALTASTCLGGGVLVELLSTLRLDHCAVIGNSANQGGGVMAYPGGEVDIRDSSLTGNSAVYVSGPGQGAAIMLMAFANLSLRSSTVSGNSLSGSGFAVEGETASLTIVNSTVADNSSGGVRSWNGETTIVQSTITDHQSWGLRFSSNDGSHPLTLVNTILAGPWNCDITTAGAYTHAGNLESADSCGLDTAAGELTWTDPRLGPLVANGGPTMTRMPRPGSPAVDAAAGAPHCEPADQRGVPRPADGDGDGVAVCDIGAVEAEPPLYSDDFESGDTSFWSAVSP